MTQETFRPMEKIARVFRDVVITEKIDGTNASIFIDEEGYGVTAASRTRWLTDDVPDNHGFRTWVYEHVGELRDLGPGHHFGEWWGSGIQRGYNQVEKRFSLFNTARWAPDGRDADHLPECVGVVPVLYTGPFDTHEVRMVLNQLEAGGSIAAPGYPFPEGVVVFHTAARTLMKSTIKDDEKGKGQ